MTVTAVCLDEFMNNWVEFGIAALSVLEVPCSCVLVSHDPKGIKSHTFHHVEFGDELSTLTFPLSHHLPSPHFTFYIKFYSSFSFSLVLLLVPCCLGLLWASWLEFAWWSFCLSLPESSYLFLMKRIKWEEEIEILRIMSSFGTKFYIYQLYLEF